MVARTASLLPLLIVLLSLIVSIQCQSNTDPLFPIDEPSSSPLIDPQTGPNDGRGGNNPRPGTGNGGVTLPPPPPQSAPNPPPPNDDGDIPNTRQPNTPNQNESQLPIRDTTQNNTPNTQRSTPIQRTPITGNVATDRIDNEVEGSSTVEKKKPKEANKGFPIIAIVGIVVGGVVVAIFTVATVIRYKSRGNRRNRLRSFSYNEKGTRNEMPFMPPHVAPPPPGVMINRNVNYDDPRYVSAVDQYHTAGSDPANTYLRY